MAKVTLTKEQVKRLNALNISTKSDDAARKGIIDLLAQNDVDGMDDEDMDTLLDLAESLIPEGAPAGEAAETAESEETADAEALAQEAEAETEEESEEEESEETAGDEFDGMDRNALKKYIKYRRIGNQHDAYIFPSQRNARMSVSCVEDIFQKYVGMAKKAYPELFKADSYPPHSMRHTTAVHMLESEVPLVVVKQFLGHEQIKTTEIYAKLSPQVANAKIADWDKKYWNEYMDEPLPEEETTFETDEGQVP